MLYALFTVTHIKAALDELREDGAARIEEMAAQRDVVLTTPADWRAMILEEADGCVHASPINHKSAVPADPTVTIEAVGNLEYGFRMLVLATRIPL